MAAISAATSSSQPNREVEVAGLAGGLGGGGVFCCGGAASGRIACIVCVVPTPAPGAGDAGVSAPRGGRPGASSTKRWASNAI